MKKAFSWWMMFCPIVLFWASCQKVVLDEEDVPKPSEGGLYIELSQTIE